MSFAGYVCEISTAPYANNQHPALQLIDARDGSPVTTATTNLPGVPLEDDEVAIKSWSENEGLLAALVEAQIVAPPHRYTRAGHVAQVPICRLLLPRP